MSVSQSFGKPAPDSFPACDAKNATPELSVVMPCLNEAGTIGACIQQVQRTLAEQNISGEIIVADNGSIDGSDGIARGLGARVIPVKLKGYGAALVAGIAAARGQYVVMADCDGTYNFSHIPRFLSKLRQGYELVMGNRFQGGIEPGAMPALHRYVGNPALSLLGRVFFNVHCGDFHCGLRAFSKSGFEKLSMRSTGMEFASEMVVKAALLGLKVTEIPTTLCPSQAGRQSHLRSWHDGWRHVRFMLLYSPRWLFLYPGAALILLGLGVGLWLLPHPRAWHGVTFDVHTLLYAMIAILIGFQAVAFAVFTKVYASRAGLLPQDPQLERMLQVVTLELGLVIGLALIIAGLASSIYAVHIWGRFHFGPLNASLMLRRVVPSVGALTLGCQIVLFSFFLGILGITRD